MRAAALWLAALATLGAAQAGPVHGQAQACSAQSGGQTAALVELYTSEGCDSCPPADRWLASLGAKGYGPQRVVPIALHVDYWDYIGWKDPYAQQRFTSRQKKLAQLTRNAIVYTPQVLLQGQDFRQWRTPAFDQAVARINAQPARARIALTLEPGRGDALHVEAVAELTGPSQSGDAGLYLASYASKLVSRVVAGENRGKTLPHDFVAFEWVGPIELKTPGRVVERRTLPLLPGAARAHSGAAAFVQDRSTAQVLQALMLPACPA